MPKKPIKQSKKPISVTLQTNNKPVAINKINPIPEDIRSIAFDDLPAWLAAYKKNPKAAARAVVMAFRRRYFMSQADAADQLKVSVNTVSKWESGKADVRWRSKQELCASGWFCPQHFGLDAPAEEFAHVDA